MVYLPDKQTPHFVRVDLADQSRIWASARALGRSGPISELLQALDNAGYLFAEEDRLLAWYGYHLEPALDREHSGARLPHVLLRLASPTATRANLHLASPGEC